jgi:hypothetical protein
VDIHETEEEEWQKKRQEETGELSSLGQKLPLFFEPFHSLVEKILTSFLSENAMPAGFLRVGRPIPAAFEPGEADLDCSTSKRKRASSTLSGCGMLRNARFWTAQSPGESPLQMRPSDPEPYGA